MSQRKTTFVHMGLALFQPLPVACIQTEHVIVFCMDEHSREEVTQAR